MERVIHEGKLYTHFKGHVYKVLHIALHTETNERMVVYQDTQNDRVFVRPYDMFNSEVDHEKYPDVKQVYRFEEK